MRTITLFVVVVTIMMGVGAIYNNKREKAIAEAEAREAFVRDSIMQERFRLQDSARIATRERIRINREAAERGHDSLRRKRECIREQMRMRSQGSERVINRCP